MISSNGGEMMYHSGDGSDPDPGAVPVKPRTAVVLGLLAGTSLVFSYLGAYAVSGALVQTEVIRAWPPGEDPRPRWLVLAFCVLLAGFLCVGGVARHLSKRQLQQIDEMGTEGEPA
jgi:hypothetical protein